MKLIYMGTPDFAVPLLETLAESQHEILAVVTQPDKPKGRHGSAMQFSPVKEKALEYGLPVLQPLKVRTPEVLEQLSAYHPDAIVVAAFGQIFPKALLDLPKYGCINIHGSLLPKYRGAAPIQWAVINGEKESGLTTMLMNTGIDQGDMLLKKSIPLAPDETGGSLFEKLSQMAGPLALETLERLEAGTLSPTPQNEAEHTYAPMLTKQMGKIDWQKSAVEIERLIRGLNPWPSAYTCMNGKTYKIWNAEVLSSEPSNSLPGTMIDSPKGKLYIQTGDGILSISVIQPEGKKRMEIDAFLRGCTFKKGERFS